MKVVIKPIDTRQINSAIDALARYSGARVEDVVEYESGKVLEGALRFTPASTVAKIRDQKSRSDFRTLDAGNGLQTYYLQNRYPNALWRKIKQARKASLQRALRSRGIAKRSWLALAEAAGLKITAPGFVRKATPSTGRTYPQNASVRQTDTGTRFGLFFSNRQPTVQGIGRAPLIRAIRGRVKYFETSLRKGVFRDLAQIAKRYPGMRIRQ